MIQNWWQGIRVPLFLGCMFFLCPLIVTARHLVVAPSGRMQGIGSLADPLALDTALRLPSGRLAPGDTLLLRGGLYKGSFLSRLNGTSSQPVVVMPYGGEWVTLDAYTGVIENVVTLTIEGRFSWFIGLEITNSAPTRVSRLPGSAPSDIHVASGISVFGEGTKIINCILHDLPGTGIGYWSTSLDAEVYGCLLYHIGFEGSDRGHGPGFYIQNSDASRPKAVRNTTIIGGYNMGMQFYAASNQLQGLMIDSCTIINSGALNTPNKVRRRNFFAGGETQGRTNADPNVPRVENLRVRHSVFFRDTTDGTNRDFRNFNDYRQNVELGFQNQDITDVSVYFDSNHLISEPFPITIHTFDTGSFMGNTLAATDNNTRGTQAIINRADGAVIFPQWNGNTYRMQATDNAIPFGEESYANWRAQGVDLASTYQNGTLPTVGALLWRPNTYDSLLLDITVVNYQRLNEWLVTLPNLYRRLGMDYELYDLQVGIQQPIARGLVQNQPIRLPMVSDLVQATLVPSGTPPRHTTPLIGVFRIKFVPRVVSVRAGNWHDPNTWSVGRVPVVGDRVEVRHAVTVAFNAFCKALDLTQGSINLQNQASLAISGVPFK